MLHLRCALTILRDIASARGDVPRCHLRKTTKREKHDAAKRAAKRGDKKQPWNYETVRPICRALARLNESLFYQFQCINRADVIQYLLTASLAAHKSYDPKKTLYVTWMNRCLRFRLIDWYRTLTKDAARTATFRANALEMAGDPEEEVYYDDADAPIVSIPPSNDHRTPRVYVDRWPHAASAEWRDETQGEPVITNKPDGLRRAQKPKR